MKRLLSLLLAALYFFALPAAQSLANCEAARTVRVGYPPKAAITDFDAYGNYTGYTYEYLEEIAQYTGWDYTFVEAPSGMEESTAALKKMLHAGSLDLMGTMPYTPLLGEQFNYASHSYGTEETVLQVLAGNERDVVINSQVTQTIRIAVLALEGPQINELDEFCRINLIEPVFVLCKTLEEQKLALTADRADMLLGTSLTHLPGVSTVASFAPKPFYFIAAKSGDPALMAELNAAMLSIAEADPYFATRLYEKYFGAKEQTFALSQAEQAYINTAGVLRVGVLTGQPPYQYEDEATGALAGIAVDLLRYIADQTGLQFEFVPVDSQEEIDALAQEGAIHLVAGMTYDYTLARERHLAMTRSYTSAQFMMVMREGGSEVLITGKCLALPESRLYQGYTLGNVKSFPQTEDCLKAVAKGHADYTYADDYTAQYYLNQPQYQNLKRSPQMYAPQQTCFGVVKPSDPALLSILNKCISAITEGDLQGIINRNMIREEALTLDSLVRKRPLETILILVFIFLVIIGTLLLSFRQRAKASRKNAVELEKHYRLYALTNEYFFEYDYRTKHLLYSVPSTEGGKGATLCKLDLNRPPLGPVRRSARESFLQVVHSEQRGVIEICMFCMDGARHWLQFALETVMDGDTPAYALGRVNIIDQQKAAQAALLEKSRQDGLTRLYNAASSRSLITQAIAALKPEERGGLIILDIDHFKAINDTFGHPVGDETLRQVAQTLQKSFRGNDVVGRIGGDEFIVYLSGGVKAESLAAKCAAIINGARSAQIPHGQFAITLSVGAVLVRPGEGYDEAYCRADQALYTAKSNGRDRYELGADTDE